MPGPPPLTMPRNPSLADGTNGALERYLNDFQTALDPSKEIGVMLSNMGGMTVHVDDIGYYNPSLIIIYGRRGDGTRVEVAIHHHQLQMVFIAVDPTPGDEPKRIGFDHD